MDANMIADMVTNSKNLCRGMHTIMERTKIQVEELANILKEQYSRQLPRNIKNDDIRKSESITLSLEDEISSLPLDEDKDISECDKMPLVLKEELHDPTLVENNELAIEEELSLQEKQV